MQVPAPSKKRSRLRALACSSAAKTISRESSIVTCEQKGEICAVKVGARKAAGGHTQCNCPIATKAAPPSPVSERCVLRPTLRTWARALPEQLSLLQLGAQNGTPVFSSCKENWPRPRPSAEPRFVSTGRTTQGEQRTCWRDQSAARLACSPRRDLVERLGTAACL